MIFEDVEGRVAAEVPADGSSVFIGRDCAVCGGDRAVSRRQLEARLSADADAVRVTVLGSNPSAVVVSRLQKKLAKSAAASSEATLFPGDAVELLEGRYRLTLRRRSDDAKEEDTAAAAHVEKATPPELGGICEYAALVRKASRQSFAAAESAAVLPQAAEEETPRQKLAAVFPNVSADALDAALRESKGEIEGAAAKLLALASAVAPEPAAVAEKAKKGDDAALQKLSALFPSSDLSLLGVALAENAGSVDAAAKWLRGGVVDAAEAAPASKRPKHSEEEKSMAVDVRVREISSTAAKATGARGRRIFAMATTAAAGCPSKLIVKIDYGRPCQSLRALKADPAELMAVSARMFGEHAQWAMYNFQAMVEREQELYKDFVVFYHSYSFAEMLYEVQAEIARAIYSLPDDFPPLPRLLRKPFDTLPLISMVVDDFSKYGSDHNPEYRALAISTSVSLFAPGSEAPPTQVWNDGYSCVDVSFRGILTGVLEACNAPRSIVEDLADAVIEVAAKYGIPTSQYQARPTYAAPSSARPQGQMLQLFVHKEWADSVAYSSHAGGTPTGAKSIVKLLSSGLADGQARVFVNPEVFLDPTKARIFHYAANPSLACTDPLTPGSRGAFILELRRVLAPIVSDPVALRRARAGIEALPSSQDRK